METKGNESSILNEYKQDDKMTTEEVLAEIEEIEKESRELSAISKARMDAIDKEIREFDEKHAPKAHPVLSEIFDWVKTIVFALLIALILNKVILVNAHVPTGSMENTIMPGDRLFGSRLAYLKSEPQRGDIIIFRYPVDEEEIYIKRLIGLPGETVEIKDGKVLIDGEILEEDYLKEEWMVRNSGLVFDVPEGYCFVMGDNRNNSLDGRYWAEEAVYEGLADSIEEAIEEKYCFVEIDSIMGKAIVRYYPSIKRLDK